MNKIVQKPLEELRLETLFSIHKLLSSLSTDRGSKDDQEDDKLLQDELLISGSDVTNAYAVQESAGWVINIFKGKGAEALSTVSNKYKGDGKPDGHTS